MQPLPSFALLHLCYYCAEADLSQLSRVFTNVRELHFSDMVPDGEDPRAIASCPHLAAVELRGCLGVAHMGLADLCAASVSLRQLRCVGCKGLFKRDMMHMRNRVCGVALQICVYQGQTRYTEATASAP